MPRATRRALPVALTAGLLFFALGAGALFAPQETQAHPPSEQPGKFMGTAQCVKCHEQGMGGRAADKLPSLKEVPIWEKKDQHAFAFRRLQDKKPPNPRWRSKVSSEEIMENLYAEKADEGGEIPEAAKSARCLSCHGIMVQDLGKPGWFPEKAERRVSENADLQMGYKASEGVSCDGCHGPASGWVESHVPDHWALDEWKKRVDPKDPEAASKKFWEDKGIWYSKDIVLWARQCVRCHLALDHELIEAKHPDLKPFEFYDQNNRVPPHWRDYTKEKDSPEMPAAGPTHYARMWQVGQVVALEDALRQVRERTTRKKGKKPSKKRVMEAIGRAWSHYVVLRHALDAQPSLADAAGKLKEALTTLKTAKKRKDHQNASQAGLDALKGLDYKLASIATTKEQVAKIEAAIQADADAKKGDAKKIAELSLIPLGKSK